MPGVEADAVVLDDELGVAVAGGDPHGRVGGPGVLADVGQRLLRHADDLHLGGGGEVELGRGVGVEGGPDAARAREHGHERVEVLQEGPLGVVGVLEPDDRLAHVALGLAAQGGQVVDVGAYALVAGHGRPGLERPQPQVRHREDLGQAVVHLAGDPVPLDERGGLPLGLDHRLVGAVDEAVHAPAEDEHAGEQDGAQHEVAGAQAERLDHPGAQAEQGDDEDEGGDEPEQAQLPQGHGPCGGVVGHGSSCG